MCAVLDLHKQSIAIYGKQTKYLNLISTLEPLSYPPGCSSVLHRNHFTSLLKAVHDCICVTDFPCSYSVCEIPSFLYNEVLRTELAWLMPVCVVAVQCYVRWTYRSVLIHSFCTWAAPCWAIRNNSTMKILIAIFGEFTHMFERVIFESRCWIIE